MQVSTIDLQQFADIIESMSGRKTEAAGPQLIHTGTIGSQVIIAMQNGADDSATLIKLG